MKIKKKLKNKLLAIHNRNIMLKFEGSTLNDVVGGLPQNLAAILAVILNFFQIF